jgi:DnaJ-domain-containing protein 1
MGTKPGANARPNRPHARGTRFHDPLHVFARYARAQARGPVKEHRRNLLEPDRRALETLGLEGHADSDAIKRAYKALVKLHHPDANGGDRSSEDRLRAIITAYTHLKNAGFVAR